MYTLSVFRNTLHITHRIHGWPSDTMLTRLGGVITNYTVCSSNVYRNNIKQKSYKLLSDTERLDDYLNSFFIYYILMYNCLET